MIQVALVLMAIGGTGFLYRITLGPTLADRVVAVDCLMTITASSFVAYGALTDQSVFLMVGVITSLLAFLGTTAFAWFIGENG